jgi:murein DD-endopeptidase MepM/ murein hydrolase activator NlpD
MVVGLLGVLVAPGLPDAVLVGAAAGGVALLGLGAALTFLPYGPALAPRLLAPPVTGRWIVMNGPADHVPSHGTHAHGQTFALDLVCDPEDGSRPAFGEGAAFRAPEEFPGFGREVLAPADGRVVAVHDGAKDHRTRSTRLAVAWMMLAAMARELAGSRHVLGNHVVLDLGDGAYAVLAHLERGSVAVRPGQEVRRGELVGRCGNSGNSSEPHLHLQVQDHPKAPVAAGLPLAFTRPGDGPDAPGHVPANDEPLDAPAVPAPASPAAASPS